MRLIVQFAQQTLHCTANKISRAKGLWKCQQSQLSGRELRLQARPKFVWVTNSTYRRLRIRNPWSDGDNISRFHGVPSFVEALGF